MFLTCDLSFSNKEFQKEVQKQSKGLWCDNVVSIKGWGISTQQHGRRPFIVMELCEYGSYRDFEKYIDERCWPRLVKMILDLASGLEYLHNISSPDGPIIHRDLSVNNFFITSNFDAKVC